MSVWMKLCLLLIRLSSFRLFLCCGRFCCRLSLCNFCIHVDRICDNVLFCSHKLSFFHRNCTEMNLYIETFSLVLRNLRRLLMLLSLHLDPLSGLLHLCNNVAKNLTDSFVECLDCMLFRTPISRCFGMLYFP